MENKKDNKLSRKVGLDAVAWRYDPIFVSDKYTVEYHINVFNVSD